MKDVYTKYECNQNAMDYFFAERGYIKRGNLRNSKIKKDIFNPINTPEAAYILGFYIADGCINGNKFVITLSEKDKEILEKMGFPENWERIGRIKKYTKSDMY